MNFIEKFATSAIAVTALSAILIHSTSADSMKPANSPTAVAAANALQSDVDSAQPIIPLNAKETPQEQLSDLQYR